MILEIRHLQFLHVAVGVQPQFVLYVLCQAAPFEVVQVFKQRLATPDQHVQDAQHQQLVPGLGDAQFAQDVAGQKALVAFDHNVHRRADQDFGQDVEELVEDRVQGRKADVALVVAGVAQEFLDRMHGLIVTQLLLVAEFGELPPASCCQTHRNRRGAIPQTLQ